MQGRLLVRSVIYVTIALITLTIALPAEARNCVRYARMLTGFEISGDAWTWWDGAAGQYARAHRPAAGAVLVFRRTGRLHYGHVATVSRVVDRRTVHVDHNWDGNESLRRGMRVVDISAHNDWSAVRVWSDYADALGNSVYPTYGFILPHSAGRPGSDGELVNATWTAEASVSRAPRSRSVLFRDAPREAPVYMPARKPLTREASVAPVPSAESTQVAVVTPATSAVSQDAWVVSYLPRRKPAGGEMAVAAVPASEPASSPSVAPVAPAAVSLADAGPVVSGAPVPRHKPGSHSVQVAALPVE